MEDDLKTKEQLLSELTELRQRMDKLGTVEAEHKQTEEALKESVSRFRNIIESSKDGIIFFDGETRKIILGNSAMAELLRCTKEDLVGRSISSLHPSEDWASVAQEFQKHVSGELSVSSGIPVIRNDDSVLYADISSSRIMLDGRTYFSAFFRDITERKRAEEALQQSEERFRAIVETSQEWIWAIDLKGQHTYSNPALKNILGYLPEEILGKESWDYMHPEDRLKAEIMVQEKIMAQEGWSGVVLRWLHRDGSCRYLESNAVPILDQQGNLVGFQGTDRDITEHKQVEEALKESEQKYRQVVENANEIIYVAQEGIIKFVNPKARDLIGYSEDELTSRPFIEFIHPDDRAMVVTRHLRRLDGAELPSIYPFRIINSAGEVRWVELNTVLIAWKGKPATLNFIRDITERKQAEESLRASEERFKRLVESVTDYIYTVKVEAGRPIATFHGPGSIMITGYTSEEYESDPELWYRMIHEEDRQAVTEQAAKVLSGEEVFPLEHRLIHKDGSIRWVRNTPVPRHDDQGRLVAYDGLIADITEHKQMDEEKERLQSQLRQVQKMEAIGTLAGGIAHDFNNILTALIGYGTLLQMGLDSDNPMRMYVDQILSSSEKAASLTQSLLAFSRKQPITLKPVKLNDLVKGTEKILRRLLTEDIALKIKLTNDDTTIMGDATQIDQILFNLATNARDAMRKGGILTIETRREELDRQFVDIFGYGEPGTYVLLSIDDTGSGMDETTKEKIFEPFFTTKEVGKGTGLGLSTVYGIVKQHNGYINLHSVPNIGTTFHIYLPAVAVALEEEIPAPPKIRQGRETILVAEDNEEVRRLIKTILTKYGYAVIEATDGDDAIDKFNKHRNIDLLIIDLIMPKKNGKEAYEEISKINSQVKVLFISGYTRDIVLDKGIEEKGFDLIPKPLSPSKLLQKVEEMLDRK